MKRIKNSYDIQDLLSNKMFKQSLDISDDLEFTLFCKDTHYNGEQFNKNSLIMIINRDNYVVNNDMRFHSLEIEEHDDFDCYIFHSIHNPMKPNKTSTLKYYLMKNN